MERNMEHRTRRVRHNSRRRKLAVQEKGHVTPRMLRIVLGGEDFEDFTTPSADDHIKLFVPGVAGSLEGRDFTPRYFDAKAKRLTIDVALHPAGPAIHWAEQAQIGDVVEAKVARAARDHIVDVRSHPMQWLRASGYWIEGRADAYERLDS